MLIPSGPYPRPVDSSERPAVALPSHKNAAALGHRRDERRYRRLACTKHTESTLLTKRTGEPPVRTIPVGRNPRKDSILQNREGLFFGNTLADWLGDARDLSRVAERSDKRCHTRRWCAAYAVGVTRSKPRVGLDRPGVVSRPR